MRAILIALVMLAIGVVVLFATAKTAAEDRRLAAEGVTVTGYVLDGYERSGRRGSKTYKLEIGYGTEDGKVRHRKEFSVSKDQYRAAGREESLSVTFLPADPAVARVGGPRNSAVGYAIGAALAAVGLGILAFKILRRRQAAASPPVAPAYAGPSQPQYAPTQPAGTWPPTPAPHQASHQPGYGTTPQQALPPLPPIPASPPPPPAPGDIGITR